MQSVTNSRLGEQVPGASRIVFQLAAELVHVLAQVLGLVPVGRAPDVLEQLALADQLAGIPGEAVDDLPFGAGEVNGQGRIIVLAYGVVGQVDVVPSDAQLRRALRGGLAASDRADPGQQLVDAERLGAVVVGTGVESVDLVVTVDAAGEHDDRNRSPGTKAVDDVDAVEVGQTEVEYDDVRMLSPCGRQGFVSVRG